MKKVLIFGGTRFFGEKTCASLIENGWQVTLATRGKSGQPFGEKVNHVLIDRSNGDHPGWKEITSVHWNAVFDNICFTKEDAELAVSKLQGKTDYYLMTSTLAVYEGKKDGYIESDFKGEDYVIDPLAAITYAEGKRQAESVLERKWNSDLGILRIPIVLDDDDYTRRLHFYVEHALKGKQVVLRNPEAKISFIKGTDAARVIEWMLEDKKSGVYNASSPDAVPLKELMEWIEEGTGMKLEVYYDADTEEQSPFSLSYNTYLKTGKLQEQGVKIEPLADWMKPLIRRLTNKSGKESAV